MTNLLDPNDPALAAMVDECAPLATRLVSQMVDEARVAMSRALRQRDLTLFALAVLVSWNVIGGLLWLMFR